MRSATLHRHATLTTLEVEAVSAPSDGGQGSPTYAAKVDVEAFTRESTELMVDSEGSEVVANLKAWVPGDESYLPSQGDRVTYAGDTYIVLDDKPVENFRSEIDHVRLLMREE